MLYFGSTKRPLINGTFEAQKYGPINRSSYNQLEEFSVKPIPKSFFNKTDLDDLDKIVDKDKINLLNELVKVFPPGSGPKMVGATQWENGGWKQTLEVKQFYGSLIENDAILSEYRERVSKILTS